MARRTLAVLAALATAAALLALPGTAAAAPGDEQLRLDTVLDGLAGPVTLTSPPGDDRRFVALLDGRVLLLRPDGSTSTFLDVQGVSVGGERGLLGLAFSPTFRDDGRFWIAYTDTDGDTVVERYEVDASAPDRADEGTRTTVLTLDQPFSNHNGGMLAFAPDGMLLVGLGDGGSANDPQGNGSDPTTLLGSILRIDVRDRAGSGYRIPTDNPWVGDGRGADEVWIHGVRNPWRFSVDPVSGDVWIGDVGQSAREEVDRVPYRPGRSFDLGWNRYEGSLCAAGPCDPAGLTFPVTEYGHDDGCSITGGYVSRAASTPSLYGWYLYADFCGGWVRGYDPASGRTVELDVPNRGNVIGFGQDADLELYVLTSDSVLALRGEGSGTRFSDVPGDGVFADAVVALADAGVTTGCEPAVPHRYCPTDRVTRGQMAAFIATAAGLEPAPHDFVDVADDGPFAGAIGALAEAGITLGCDPAGERFCPGDPVSRIELAAFLARALDLADAPEEFVDVPDDHPLARAVGAVAAEGITAGCDVSGERFCPGAAVVRAEMAAFLTAAFDL